MQHLHNTELCKPTQHRTILCDDTDPLLSFIPVNASLLITTHSSSKCGNYSRPQLSPTDCRLPGSTGWITLLHQLPAKPWAGNDFHHLCSSQLALWFDTGQIYWKSQGSSSVWKTGYLLIFLLARINIRTVGRQWASINVKERNSLFSVL